jgi:hypothetical protein
VTVEAFGALFVLLAGAGSCVTVVCATGGALGVATSAGAVAVFAAAAVEVSVEGELVASFMVVGVAEATRIDGGGTGTVVATRWFTASAPARTMAMITPNAMGKFFTWSSLDGVAASGSDTRRAGGLRVAGQNRTAPTRTRHRLPQRHATARIQGVPITRKTAMLKSVVNNPSR